MEQNPKLDIEQVRKIYHVEDYFNPLNENVIFASVIDGWGFRLSDMAEFYSKKWGMKKEPLRNCFYGEFYYDPKTKVISKKDSSGRKKTIFV